MRILVDMDDVIADTIERFFEWYEKDFGIRYSRKDIMGTKLHEIVPAAHKDVVKKLSAPGRFFRELPLIEKQP